VRGPYVLVGFFLLLSFAVSLHQFVVWGKWFQLEDLHHETWILVCLAAALGVWIGSGLSFWDKGESAESG